MKKYALIKRGREKGERRDKWEGEEERSQRQSTRKKNLKSVPS